MLPAGRPLGVGCNVVSSDATTLLDWAVEFFGSLDVMVNNAGITRDATMRKMTEQDFDDVISVHLRGCRHGTRLAAGIMRENGGGSIINLSSISGKVGFRRSDEPLRGQGRRRRSDEGRGQGGRVSRGARQRRPALPHPHGHDLGDAAESVGPEDVRNPEAAGRGAFRGHVRRAVLCVEPIVVHDRNGHGGHGRPLHVEKSRSRLFHIGTLPARRVVLTWRSAAVSTVSVLRCRGRLSRGEEFRRIATCPSTAVEPVRESLRMTTLHFVEVELTHPGQSELAGHRRGALQCDEAGPPAKAECLVGHVLTVGKLRHRYARGGGPVPLPRMGLLHG